MPTPWLWWKALASGGLLGGRGDTTIFVGRSRDIPGYDHGVDYSFHPAHGDVEEHTKKSVVEWGDDGVTFIGAAGHSLFIPKEMLIDGR